MSEQQLITCFILQYDNLLLVCRILAGGSRVSRVRLGLGLGLLLGLVSGFRVRVSNRVINNRHVLP